MFDLTTSKKDVMKSIAILNDQSIPKPEIFQQIKSKYPQFDQDSIAKEVASYIIDDVKKKNKIPVYLLSIFASVSYLINLITPFSSTYKISSTVYWISVIIYGIILIYFIVGFLRFKLFYYTTAVSLYSIYLLYFVYVWFIYPVSWILILSTLGIVITFLFLFYLRKQLFPNINFWGNVVKENCNYKL